MSTLPTRYVAAIGLCAAAFVIGSFLGWYSGTQKTDDALRTKLPSMTGNILTASETEIVMTTKSSGFKDKVSFTIDPTDLAALRLPHIKQHIDLRMLSDVYYRESPDGVRHAKIVADSGAQKKL